jgi:hypothetical protein
MIRNHLDSLVQPRLTNRYPGSEEEFPVSSENIVTSLQVTRLEPKELVRFLDFCADKIGIEPTSKKCRRIQ